MRSRAAHLLRLLAVAALVLTSAGCARVFGSHSFGPSGLPAGEDRLRQMLTNGQAVTAYERLDGSAPEDDVLRALFAGVVAYHAGDYETSARVLDTAGELADDRITKSVSRSMLSVISNDLVLPYEPGRTERLMIPYYAALARSRLGDTESAAVEARRLSLLLQRYRDDGDVVDPRLAATLHYVAGALFEAHGDRAAADVAYRNAVALDSTLVVQPVADGAGTVLIVLEQGFVAHRVEQGLAVMLLPEEVHAIAYGDGEDKAMAAALVAGRVLERAALHANAAPARGYTRGASLFVPAPDHTPLPVTRRRTVCRTVSEPTLPADSSALPRPVRAERQECTEKEEKIDELPYLLKVAWPVYRSDYRPEVQPRAIAGADTVRFATGADVSRGVLSDFEGERALIVARTIARGTAKLALTKGAERKLEEKNEVAGMLVGLIGNIGNVLLERADLRSWHLLPGGITVARVELPAGEHALSVDVDGRTLTLDPVTVMDGRVALVPVRTW